jgi:spore coat protein U-like protein
MKTPWYSSSRQILDRVLRLIAVSCTVLPVCILSSANILQFYSAGVLTKRIEYQSELYATITSPFQRVFGLS